jgi:hypothetical protein
MGERQATNENLQLWKLQEYLTLHEAVCLAIGIEPSSFLMHEGHSPPTGWTPLYNALYAAIEDYLSQFGIEEEEGAIFNKSNVIEPEENNRSIGNHRITQNAFRKWLNSKGLKPSFFFSKKLTVPDRLPVRENQPKNPSLEFWRLREWLTIHEASCLALGCDPNIRDEEPIGWKGFYSALGEAVVIDMKTEYEYDKALDIVLSPDTRYYTIYQGLLDRKDNLIFSESTVKGYELGQLEEFSPPPIDEVNIKVTAIKEWLTLKSIKPPFFFPDEPEQQTVISKPEYQTRLMSIMYETINRYYGENYDPSDRDTVPNQIRLIAWLRDTYSLSDPEAKAIDKILRPEQVKRPQGKK